MRITTIFIAFVLMLITILFILVMFNLAFSNINGATQLINNLTSDFPNASVSTTFPANSFAYTISSYASTYGVWVVITILLGIIVYVGYSKMR